jgi:hypothetical protein
MAQQQTRLENVTIENAIIRFRNFSGKEGQFNAKGNRNFSVFLPEEDGHKFEALGWPVKWLKSREEEDGPQAMLTITVKYSEKARPPRVILINSRGRTDLGENEIEILDWAEIEKVDLTIRPYHWEVSGKQGVKPYLQAIYITIHEDELEKKYANVPDSAASIMIPEEPDFDGYNG